MTVRALANDPYQGSVDVEAQPSSTVRVGASCGMDEYPGPRLLASMSTGPNTKFTGGVLFGPLFL